MRCPECGKTELVRECRDQTHTYRGQLTVIPTTGTYCPACGEGVLDNEEWARVDALVLAFRREVNNSLGEPELIASVRRKLNLDQKRAAALFGGGVNAFSRYERGKAKPPVALTQLFRILDCHPEMLRVLQPDVALSTQS